MNEIAKEICAHHYESLGPSGCGGCPLKIPCAFHTGDDNEIWANRVNLAAKDDEI